MPLRTITASAAFFTVLALASGARPDAATYPVPPAAPVPNDHVKELEGAIAAIAGEAAFKDASLGIAIVDVDSGHTLAATHEHDPLNPASNAKIYTAAAALSLLHGDHRYETTLSGKYSGHVVDGPLVLRGHGDPSLRAADLWALVEELRARGITRVTGDLVVDQTFHDDQFTPAAFDQQPNEWASFRAPVSAVAVNENTVTLTVRAGAEGAAATASFDPPGFVEVDGTVSTAAAGGADTVGLALAPDGKRLSAKLSGAIAADSRMVRYTRRVDDPGLLAGYVLRSLLADAGIKFEGQVRQGNAAGEGGSGNVLARHASAPLAVLLQELGKVSDNFYAEMIFKSLAGERKGRPARGADAADLVTRWVTQVGAGDAGLVIKNGSGLFDGNRITASSCASLLRAVYRDPSLEPEFVAQLSIGGVDGTLRNRFPAEKTRRAVRAKTGTLDDAIALSGYVLGPNGKGTIAFSILFNHVEGKAHLARAAADKLVELIARRSWGG